MAKLQGLAKSLSDLENKTKIVRQTFGIIAFNIQTNEVNMEDKKKHQRAAHLIIEYANTDQANTAIDKRLVIGSELKICCMYNKVCQIQ